MLLVREGTGTGIVFLVDEEYVLGGCGSCVPGAGCPGFVANFLLKDGTLKLGAGDEDRTVGSCINEGGRGNFEPFPVAGAAWEYLCTGSGFRSGEEGVENACELAIFRISCR